MFNANIMFDFFEQHRDSLSDSHRAGCGANCRAVLAQTQQADLPYVAHMEAVIESKNRNNSVHHIKRCKVMA